MSNLYQANQQWSTRPDDERFWSLTEMVERCRHYAESAGTSTSKLRTLQVQEADGQNLAIVGPTGQPALLTHWSAAQLATRVQTPIGYLRTLPPQMAAMLLNFGLQNRTAKDDEAKLLIHRNGSMVCRAATTDSYARIWNYELLEKILPLQSDGWQVPPARPARHGQAGSRIATAEDVLRISQHGQSGCPVKVGDMIAPAGLYASDHDCFAFLVNESVTVDDGSDGGLCRGFFVSNSEVGAASLKFTSFLYRSVCGNHIVWGAKQVKEMRIIHTGRNDSRFGAKLVGEIRKYHDSDASADQKRIDTCRRFEIAATKKELLDALFSRKIAPMKTLEAAYTDAEQDYDETGSAHPRTAWGFAQGLTHLSQQSSHADDRNELDRAAGKVLAMAF